MSTTARIAELEQAVAAAERTIEVLMDAVEMRTAAPGGDVAAVEDAVRLARVVDLKTRELAEERHKLSAALGELASAQAELTQSHKLTAIGQLAAGIAHEINTPIQYVGDNLVYLQKVFEMTLPVIEQAARASAGDAEALATLPRLIERLKLSRLTVQVPRALEQSLEGVARVGKIVGAMKEFSHPSGGEKAEVDLGSAIESTVTIARNEWKYVADVELDIPADMPPVCCLRDELNQVILNLVVNAAHAITEAIGAGAISRGAIRISTRIDGRWCEIRVSDTGTGIPEDIRTRVFDPFFTTKPVGQGTGQGLAIAYNVVVEKHAGTIAFESELGKGTTFIIRIPRDGDGVAREAA